MACRSHDPILGIWSTFYEKKSFVPHFFRIFFCYIFFSQRFFSFFQFGSAHVRPLVSSMLNFVPPSDNIILLNYSIPVFSANMFGLFYILGQAVLNKPWNSNKMDYPIMGTWLDLCRIKCITGHIEKHGKEWQKFFWISRSLIFRKRKSRAGK